MTILMATKEERKSNLIKQLKIFVYIILNINVTCF